MTGGDLDPPFAVNALRDVRPAAIRELWALDGHAEGVPGIVRARRRGHDGVEAGSGRDDEALVLGVEDEEAAGDEHLARARDDRCCHPSVT